MKEGRHFTKPTNTIKIHLSNRLSSNLKSFWNCYLPSLGMNVVSVHFNQFKKNYLYSKIKNFIVIFRKFCTRDVEYNFWIKKMFFFLIIRYQLSKQILDSLTIPWSGEQFYQKFVSYNISGYQDNSTCALILYFQIRNWIINHF